MRKPINLAVALASLVLLGAEAPMPPAYNASPASLHIWVYSQMARPARDWMAQFQRLHPGLRIKLRQTGSDIAMAGLYTGKADIALIGRHATDPEIKAFEWIYGKAPRCIAIMAGSARQAGQSPALAILVHAGNPIRRFTLADFGAIFGAAKRTTLHRWGELGLTGVWADKPIHLYGPDAESGTGRFFRQAVLAGSDKMNWDQFTEFPDPVARSGFVDTSGDGIVSALAGDRYGLAIANSGAAKSAVRVVAVAAGLGHGDYLPTAASVGRGDYPLARTAYACFNASPREANGNEIRAFLRGILSKRAQSAIGQTSSYLPLGADRAQASAESLKH